MFNLLKKTSNKNYALRASFYYIQYIISQVFIKRQHTDSESVLRLWVRDLFSAIQHSTMFHRRQ